MNRLQEIKKRGFFSGWDALVYAVLLLFALALFLVFALGADRRAVEGFAVYCDGEQVYTYSFTKGGTVAEGWEENVSQVTEGETVRVTVRTGGGYNVLTIDLANKSAKMTDADCSRGKDCTHMAAIARRDGVIVCVPHALKVLALGGAEDYDHPAVG